MTISVVQTATANSGWSGTFASNVTPANSLIMVATGYQQTGVSVSPTFNGSPVTGAAKLIEKAGGDDLAAIWLLPNVSGAAKGFSVTVTGSLSGAFVGTICYEVAGLGAAPGLDLAASASGSGAGDQSSGATGNITRAPEIIVGAVVQDGTAGTLPSSPWTTTTLPGNGSNNSFAGYQIATSSGGSYTYNAASGSAVWAAVAAAVYATPPAASGRSLIVPQAVGRSYFY